MWADGAIIAAILAAVVIIEAFRFFFPSLNAPVPKGPKYKSWPLIGNLLDHIGNSYRINDYLTEVTEQLDGKTWSINVPIIRQLIITDPANVEHMLKTNFDNYEKGSFFQDIFKDFLGEGIFLVDGEKWQRQRKIAAKIFSRRQFRDRMVEVFTRHSFTMGQLLQEAADTQATVDLHDLFYRFTLDSFAEIAMAKQLNCLQSEEPPPFAKAFDYVQHSLIPRFFFGPFWRIIALCSSRERRIRHSLKVMDQFAFECITERRQLHKTQQSEEGKASSGPSADLLSLFLEAEDEDGLPLSDQYLRDVVLNFMLAGRDTTAQMLAWCCHMLVSPGNEVVQERLREEIDQAMANAATEVGTGKKGGLDYNSIRSLKYLHAVLSETLRLYPPVSRDPKVARGPDTLPDGTIVHKGTILEYCPWVMGRKTSIWGEDAKSFDPERWLERTQSGGGERDEVQLKTLPSPFKYPVFQAGPRVCLGQAMAFLEAKIALVHLLHRFELTAATGYPPVTYLHAVTLPMKGGLHVNVRERVL
jgi:cytochrome P450